MNRKHLGKDWSEKFSEKFVLVVCLESDQDTRNFQDMGIWSILELATDLQNYFRNQRISYSIQIWSHDNLLLHLVKIYLLRYQEKKWPWGIWIQGNPMWYSVFRKTIQHPRQIPPQCLSRSEDRSTTGIGLDILSMLFFCYFVEIKWVQTENANTYFSRETLGNIEDGLKLWNIFVLWCLLPSPYLAQILNNTSLKLQSQVLDTTLHTNVWIHEKSIILYSSHRTLS